jgi:vacuolar protein sorting-associated protein VTA1
MIGKSPTFRSEQQPPSESSIGKRNLTPPGIPSHFVNFGKATSITAPFSAPDYPPVISSPSVQVPTRSSSHPAVSYFSTADQTAFHKYDPKIIDQATKFCKYALSALQYQDVTAARDNLKKALTMLATLEPS